MWKTLSSQVIFTHPRMTLVEDEVILPSGVTTKYLKIKNDGRNSVTVIAECDGKILVQREYSYPPDCWLYQFPGGDIKIGEDLLTGANRELAEEMGFVAKKLELIGEYFMTNRRSNKKMYIYLATDLEEKHLPADLEEEIGSFWFSTEEIDKMIKDGQMQNCHFLAAWSLYKSKKTNEQ